MAQAKKRPNALRGAHIPIHPLHDRIIIKPLSPEEMGTTTASGIIIPDSAQEKPEQGTVVAIGPGKYDDGVRIPVSVAVGDRVLFSKYGYDTVKIGGVEYYVVSESNILAVITK
jgi:chaperonin GroES